MKLTGLDLRRATVPLSRPYAVATYACDTAAMVRVTLHAGGLTGIGTATPEAEVTGETFAACAAGIEAARDWLVGRTFTSPAELQPLLDQQLPQLPGARAALDLALHDVWGKSLGRPVVDLLGRVHDALPTSITIGVRDVPATLAEAAEYVGRGFRVLKVKTGVDVDLDVERMARLRERHPDLALLVDANVGYDLAALRQFLDRTRALDIRLIEQPLPPAADALLRTLPEAERARLVADESLQSLADAIRLAAAPTPFGIWNIKLMKCGGITAARHLAATALAAGIRLLWGCMDESVVGIAGALHAAYSCAATERLDLDGSFDLARDLATGGFRLQDGILHTLPQPGLGVTARDD